MKIEQVPIKKIHVGTRHRIDAGDIESLAANIRDLGLLQPIGIDSYYNLIFGARRLEACEDILKWTEIPCVVLDLESMLAGEYSENKFRENFTPTELLAISKALEQEEFKKQQGKRTDKLPDSYPEVRGVETRSKIAKAAGFESDFSMRQAQQVVKRGAPEVIKAMDKGDLSISAAATIATQPKKDQAAIVAMPKEERREILQQIRKTKADKEADERRARDIRLFRGLYDAVKFIGTFYEEPKEAWAGLWRVSAYDFKDHMDRAYDYLTRLRKEHPNEPRKPERVSPTAS